MCHSPWGQKELDKTEQLNDNCSAHAAQLLSPRAATPEAPTPQPALRHKGSHRKVSPRSAALLSATREKPTHSNEDPPQPKMNTQINKFKRHIHFFILCHQLSFNQNTG